MAWKIEDVKKYIETFDYELLDNEFNGVKNKMNLLCPNGELFIVSFDKFKNSNQRCKCKKCKNINPRAYTYDYVKQVFNDNGYILKTEKYENNKQLLEVECPSGHKWQVAFGHFNCGRRCYYCSHSRQYTISEIRMNFSKYGYTLLSKEYSNVYDKLLIKCNKGHIYETSFHNFDNGKRCPYCNNKYSRGEYKVIYILDKYHINYIHQHWFQECRDKLPLPFDFYLSKYNCCIEFDGEGHYEPRNWNGVNDSKAIKSFEETQKHDNMKTQYCKKNNMKLIRIPYWNFDNIESIICQELNISPKIRRRGNRKI